MNRPILIFHYNPNKNTIFVTDPDYELSKFKLAANNEFFNLTAKNENGVLLTVYIFDHKYAPVHYTNVVVIKDNYEQIFSKKNE